MTMNLLPEAIESGSGKVASALYSTPGTNPFVGLDSGPVRGQILTGGRAFAVGGSVFSETLSNQTKINFGLVANDGLPVSMAAGPTQILIASAGIAYVFDISTGIITASTLNQGGNSGIASSSLASGGSSYLVGDTFIVQAGNGDALGVVDSVSSGVVLTYHLTSVGTGYLLDSNIPTIPTTGGGSGLTLNILTLGGGYAINDTGVVNGGTVQAQYLITSVDANGSVVAYTITSKGAGYSAIVGLTTSTGGLQPGIGTGFQINVTSVGVANTFSTIPSQTLSNVNQVGFCDGFFVACLKGSETFQASNLEDATTWNPLSTSTISVFVDTIQAMLVDHRQIWLWGLQKAVVYYDSGNAPFPFDLIPGAFIEQGIVASNSPVQLDNSVFWLGGDQRGSGIAWRANGYTPTRVSNHAVEFAWQGYSRIDDAVGYSYQDQGHSFWVLFFPTANKTWVFDVATSLWHERGYWNEINGIFTAHRSQNHIFAFGKHLVGDWMTGNIYQMDIRFATDSGNPIRRVRRAPHVSTEQEWIYHHQLQIDLETGLGPQPPLNGPSTFPSQLFLSDSFGNPWTLTIDDGGLIHTSAGADGPIATLILNDFLVDGESWLIGIDGDPTSITYQDLTTTAVAFGDYPTIFPMATTPSALDNALFVGAGQLYTNVSLPANRGPFLNLRWSDDGGHTWSNEHTVDCGQAGRFKTRAIFYRLGRSRDRVYELSMSDPIAWRLLEADLKASPGFSESERVVSQYRKVS